jgi:hypothetical protein
MDQILRCNSLCHMLSLELVISLYPNDTTKAAKADLIILIAFFTIDAG